MADADILEETDLYIHEKGCGVVSYFIKEGVDLIYADRPWILEKRAQHTDLRSARADLDYWGTVIAVRFLTDLLRAWPEELARGLGGAAIERSYGYRPRILLGDLSMRGGGKRPGHRTHEYGTQIDLYYLTKNGANQEVHYVPSATARPKKAGAAAPASDPYEEEVFLEDQGNWHGELNARLLAAICAAGADRILTECDPFLDKSGRFAKYHAEHRIERLPPHRDHFHVELYH